MMAHHHGRAHGAAYAAQLGPCGSTKRSTPSPRWYLALRVPRPAPDARLILMMPLLTIYAGPRGISGAVGVACQGRGRPVLEPHVSAASLADFRGHDQKCGLGVSSHRGCMRGMQSGRSSAAVGLAATSAVVTGIVFVIVSDASSPCL